MVGLLGGMSLELWPVGAPPCPWMVSVTMFKSLAKRPLQIPLEQSAQEGIGGGNANSCVSSKTVQLWAGLPRLQLLPGLRPSQGLVA